MAFWFKKWRNNKAEETAEAEETSEAEITWKAEEPEEHAESEAQEETERTEENAVEFVENEDAVEAIEAAETVETPEETTKAVEELEEVIGETTEDAFVLDGAVETEESMEAEAAMESDELSVSEEAEETEETKETEEAEDSAEPEEPKKKGFFARLKEGLTKTRKSLSSGLNSIFSGFSHIDDDFYEELEEVMIMSDLGVRATNEILEKLKQQVKEQHIKEPQACKQLLSDTIKEQMRVDEEAYQFEHQTSVVLVIGVNGVGKTTTIGKLAGQYKKAGKKVVLAAADTFRAAAIEQLTEWAHRAGVDIIAGQEGSDPASVIYDAIAAAKARKADILLCDTAGRLHNKKNLMEELKKINRIIEREYPEAYRENLIVLDGTTGQNALVQAKQFKETADITGIVLTKLDGTAKGGIAIAIQAELGVPVKYIGIGEKIEDLQKFDTDAFVDALFTPAEEN